MTKRVLLLQGPIGGFFGNLRSRLAKLGFEARCLVFNGGDYLFALGTGCEVARVPDGDFSRYFNRLLDEWRPDCIILIGDERPIHLAAMAAAKARGITVWCFEEGYIRPDYVTLERDGVNANSSLPRSFRRDAEQPPLPRVPRLPADAGIMGIIATIYYNAYHLSRFLFPGYVHHRRRPLVIEFFLWNRSFIRRALGRRRDAAIIARLTAPDHPPFFMLALQVHDDMQLVRHGRGWTNESFLDMVMRSFAAHAPADHRLLIKAHPLDIGHGNHRRVIRHMASQLGIEARVDYLQVGPISPLARRSHGLVTINSTAGLAALRDGVPVMAFGEALYHVDGLTPRPDGPADLDRFWRAPVVVDPVVMRRFAAHIVHSALLPGSFYLRGTWPRLAADVAERLLGIGPTGDPLADAKAWPTTRSPSPYRVGIGSAGLLRRRRALTTLLHARPVRVHRWFLRQVDFVAAWGNKENGLGLSLAANARRIPFLRLEDGFLRSVRPGPDEPRVGWIVDATGVYYDASRPSDLERHLFARLADPDRDHDRAAAALDRLRALRLSKYNHAPDRDPTRLGLPSDRPVVIVIDQTFGDASVAGAGADAGTFRAMLAAAIAENPDATVAVKVHPETNAGAKRGYLAECAHEFPVRVINADVNPWSLIDIAARVYVVSSQFGMEAMLAGVPVTCFGRAFYAGWGLTDDRFERIARRQPGLTREAFAAAVYFDYCRWLDPVTDKEIDFETAIERLALQRDRHFDNRGAVCVGFSRWKRRAATRFLTGIGGRPKFFTDIEAAKIEARAAHADLVVWGMRDIGECPPGVRVVRAEDGFLRSVGLGAAFNAPASLVFDDEGIYYDPRRSSRFETLALTATFDDALVARAASLRQAIVERRLSKYNDSAERPFATPSGRLRILVPGQVEDDASMRCGSPEVRTNLELLRRVRARWPDAHIIFKPHPDVVAGYRAGGTDPAQARAFADQIVTDIAMPTLLATVDRVETMTSLTGFEALLRGLAVATHGTPFYAGWGLTEDLLPCPRRTRVLGLDQLVAVALILYPRYVDPLTGQPCPVETIVERLAERRAAAATPLAAALRRIRHAYAWTAHNLLGPLWKQIKFL